jgi:acyl carrier protein
MRDYRGELQDIFRDLFDDDDIVIKDTTTAPDIEGWDSLNNVRLMVRIEEKFGFRFNTGEVVSLKSVGDLVKLIEERVRT